MLAILKPRGDIRQNWINANPILRLREWGVEWEETVGVGEVKIKIGDGSTPWNELNYAIVNNVTEKIVDTFAQVSAENPELIENSSIAMICGVIKKKFEYVFSKINEKISTSNIVNICTSSDIDKPLSANQGKILMGKIEEKSNTGHGHGIATQSSNGFMSASDKEKLDGISASANNYSHPTSSGNKHIPSGGSSGQILRWSADGTAAWGSDNNTTYGTATQSANGLMSAADKKKLDGVATNANNYSHPSTHAASMITQDDTHRFVTDTEKSTWNGKAAGNHNHDGSYVKKNSTAEVGGIMIGNKATDGYGWIDIFFNKIHNYSIYPEQTRLIFKSLHSGPLMGFNFIGAKLMAGGSEVLTFNRFVDNCTSDRTDLIPTAKQAKLLMDKYNQLNSEKLDKSSSSQLVTAKTFSMTESFKSFTTDKKIPTVGFLQLIFDVGLERYSIFFDTIRNIDQAFPIGQNQSYNFYLKLRIISDTSISVCVSALKGYALSDFANKYIWLRSYYAT